MIWQLICKKCGEESTLELYNCKKIGHIEISWNCKCGFFNDDLIIDEKI